MVVAIRAVDARPGRATAVARVLDMKKTLDENGIPDETAAFDDLDIPDGYYVPTIHLYFSDDLTVA